MIARLTFLAIVLFWLTMNFLLWRTMYGSHGDTPVPLTLVWRKILTAPDASSLSIFQNRRRMGYCEISTGVGQQMAGVDEDQLPPAGLMARAGYQLHILGDTGLNEFTNRLKFDAHLSFFSARKWREINLKISTRSANIEINSSATNQIVHVKITSDGAVIKRDLTVADLQNPNALLRAFTGDFGGMFFDSLDLPFPSTADATQNLHWDARRTRLKIGAETLPVYRVETTMLGNVISADISTVGEILDVNLPGDLSAHIDELTHSHD